MRKIILIKKESTPATLLVEKNANLFENKNQKTSPTDSSNFFHNFELNREEALKEF